MPLNISTSEEYIRGLITDIFYEVISGDLIKQGDLYFLLFEAPLVDDLGGQDALLVWVTGGAEVGSKICTKSERLHVLGGHGHAATSTQIVLVPHRVNEPKNSPVFTHSTVQLSFQNSNQCLKFDRWMRKNWTNIKLWSGTPALH